MKTMRKSRSTSAGKSKGGKKFSVILHCTDYARLARAAKEQKRSVCAQASFFLERCVSTQEEAGVSR